MAERKGLEPSASGVTGRRYNRLNYRSVKKLTVGKHTGQWPAIAWRRNKTKTFRLAIFHVRPHAAFELVGGTGLEPVTLGL